MTTVTTTDWTLTVEADGYCTVRQYRTKTEYRGDEAFHKGTEAAGWVRFPLDDLPKYIRERAIVEFSRDEDMQLICSMPVE